MTKLGFSGFTYHRLHQAFTAAVRRAGIERFEEHAVFARGLSDESTVLNLGANRGGFYTQAHRRFGCRCIAVEAAPDLFKSLPPVPRLDKFNMAIHSENGDVLLRPSSNPQANSVDPSISQGYGVTGWVGVRGVTLENLVVEAKIDEIDYLKVDIEGSELGMFDTTSDELLLKVGQVMVEFHDFLKPEHRSRIVAILQRMRRLGFVVLVLGSVDYGEVLMLNARYLRLTGKDRRRLTWLRLIIRIRRIRARLAGTVRIRKASPGPS